MKIDQSNSLVEILDVKKNNQIREKTAKRRYFQKLLCTLKL